MVICLPTEDMTEAVHYARITCSKQSMNFIFVRFTDENLFTLNTLRNSKNDRPTVCTCSNKQRHQSKTVYLHKNGVQSLMVSVGVSKLHDTGLILVDPRIKK